MRPAFSSTKQAAAFALLLLVLLAFPVLMGKNLLPPREQAYSIQGWDSGPYPWIRNQIFEETNAIDIAFVGSSHILCGIDTTYVQQKLSEKLGRQAVVRTIGWGGSGYDGLYLVTQDLLQHRKVKVLVFYDEKVEMGETIRFGALASLFSLACQASVLSGLPFRDQSAYYIVALMGMPRTLFSLARPNIPAELFSHHSGYIQPDNKGFLAAPNCLGAVNGPTGFSSNSFNTDHAPFVPYHPNASALSCLYPSSAGAKSFKFSHTPLLAWHLQFAKAFAALANRRGCQLVMLDIPVYGDRRNAVILERAFWPGLLATNLLMLGLPPVKMFGGMTDEEVQYLFGDPVHLNQNGQEYFTRLVTPQLIKIYETSTNH